jgi:V/A-type H+-transporting ATPase subunit D
MATKGLNLLKLKRQALILEFFNISRKAAALRGGLHSKLLQGYESIRMAEILAGPLRLENEAMKIPKLRKLQITSKNVMGIRIPQLEGGDGMADFPELFLELPTSINEAIKAFRQIHQIVLDVAEKETALRKLLYEIEKTKRRSNAIENVLIPRLEAAAKYIKFRFDEMERDTFIMLKTVKRKMGEKQNAVNV